MGEMESQGIIRVGLTVFARWMEVKIQHPPASAGWVEGGINKRTVFSVSTSVWAKAAPLALILKPNKSILLHMFLEPFELPPQSE